MIRVTAEIQPTHELPDRTRWVILWDQTLHVDRPQQQLRAIDHLQPASGGVDGTIRLWPMPEGPPFHTLPYEEILEWLRSVTNLRVVEGEDSATGYDIEVGPFPGWETLPKW